MCWVSTAEMNSATILGAWPKPEDNKQGSIHLWEGRVGVRGGGAYLWGVPGR